MSGRNDTPHRPAMKKYMRKNIKYVSKYINTLLENKKNTRNKQYLKRIP